MPEEKTSIEDHFPKCKGKHNAKFTDGVYLWVCGVDPSIYCSRRYTINDEHSRFKDHYLCNYIIWPKK